MCRESPFTDVITDTMPSSYITKVYCSLFWVNSNDVCVIATFFCCNNIEDFVMLQESLPFYCNWIMMHYCYDKSVIPRQRPNTYPFLGTWKKANLQMTNTLEPAMVVLFLEVKSINYCYAKGLHNSILCWEAVLILYWRFHHNYHMHCCHKHMKACGHSMQMTNQCKTISVKNWTSSLASYTTQCQNPQVVERNFTTSQNCP